MTDFVYAWFYDEDSEQWLLIVSEKDYFEAEGAMNDSYSEDVLEELDAVMEELACSELAESTYELDGLSKDEVEAYLRELENFHKDTEFAAFVGA